jgi:hypothetical protein
VSELHRHDNALDDECRTEPGSDSQEEHLAALVAAERLHRRVVDDLRRLPEHGAEVESDPPGAEVHRLGDDAPRVHRRGNADRDGVVRPVVRQVDDPLGHALRPELGTGFEAPALPAAAGQEQLDVRTADVDREDRRLRHPRSSPPARPVPG